MYRAALNYGEVATPLFLAVPTAAYEGIFNEDIGRQAIAKAGMNLIIFDPDKEEISLWIP